MKLKQLLTLSIALLLSGSMVVGCNPKVGEEVIDNEQEVVKEEKPKEEEQKEEVEVKEETKEAEEAEVDLPGLNDEEAYFKALNDFYENINNYDVEGVINNKFYTKDKEGEVAKSRDEKSYSKNLELMREYFTIDGLKTYTEVEEVEEGDGTKGYRAQIIFMKLKNLKDENGELIVEESINKLDSIQHISVATMGYEVSEEQWKVLNIGDIAIFRTYGTSTDDWEKYIDSGETTNWIGEYGQWYEELNPEE